MPPRPLWLALAFACQSVTELVQGQVQPPAAAPGSEGATAPGTNSIPGFVGSEDELFTPGVCIFGDDGCSYNACSGSATLEYQKCTARLDLGLPCDEGSGCQPITLSDGGEICGLPGDPPDVPLTIDDFAFLAEECAGGFPEGSLCRETVMRLDASIGCHGCFVERDDNERLAQFCGALSDEMCDGAPVPCDELSAGTAAPTRAPAMAPSESDLGPAGSDITTDTPGAAAPSPLDAGATRAGRSTAAPATGESTAADATTTPAGVATPAVTDSRARGLLNAFTVAGSVVIAAATLLA